MKLAQRTIHNAFFSSLSWFLPILLSFLLTPYIVHELGNEAYGILALVWSVVGYFALLDLGMENAVVKYVAEHNGRGEIDETNRVVGVALLVFIVVGVVGGLVILALASPLSTSWLKVPPALERPAYLAFCLAGAGFLFTMVVRLFTAIPNGLNRYDITSLVNVAMGALTTLGTALLLYLERGLVEVVALNTLLPVATIFLYRIIIKRVFPEIRVSPSKGFSTFKRILHFGMYNMMSRIAYIVVHQVDRLVIGALLGVGLVTYYVVPFTIVGRITALTNRIAVVIFPAVSELHGQADSTKIADLYLTSSRIIFVVGSALCIPLLVFGPRLLSLWMGADFGEVAGNVMVLTTLGTYINIFTNVPTFVADGLGRPRVSGIAAVSTAIIFLVLLFPMANGFGITGVAASYLLSSAVVMPVFVTYVNRHLVGLRIRDLLLTSYFRPGLTCLLALGLAMAVPQGRIHTVWTLLGVIGCCALAFFLLAIPTGALDRREREALFAYVTSLVRRRNA